MRKLFAIKFYILIFLSLFMMSPLLSVSASADTLVASPAAAIIPLEVEPVCSDASAGQADWKVTNKNSAAVNVHWTNLYNNNAGNYLAASGVSQMITSYDASDANNTTQFMSGTDTNQTNATKAACAPATVPVVTPPAPLSCVDGHTQQNLIVTYTANDTVHITTKDGATLCADQDVYFSSYIMPANYNGQGFYNNPTAYPQTGFSSTHITLSKDTAIDVTLQIALPDSCNNVQVDVYYAPEITAVGPDGHGTQNILSNVYLSSSACAPVNGGGNGPGSTGGSNGGNTGSTTGDTGSNGGNTAPTTPAAPTGPAGGYGGGDLGQNTPGLSSNPAAPVTAYQLPTTLPNTGGGLSLNLLAIPLLVAVIGFYSAEEFQKRRYL